jgi:SAM-dependent methyltransferase
MTDFAEGQVWASAEPYERYVGRWSRLVAREFVAWLDAAPRLRWLDVGCGTGALAQVVTEHAAPGALTGIDASVDFVAAAGDRVPDAEFLVADAQALPFDDGAFDVAVSGLVLNFVPQPVTAVREMRRVVGPDGIVAAYVWDYAGRMQLIRYFWDLAGELDARARELDEGRRFGAIANADGLEALFTEAGLREPSSRAVDVPTRFADFDDYWEPFTGGQGPAPAYAMSLDEEGRERLRELLRQRLPVASDGSVDLVARAWAVRARR